MKKTQKTDDRVQSGENVKRITLARSVSVEMEERKSIFIGHASPVASEDEARAFIDAKRREFHDATHNVYAYMLNGGAIARYSDDGEPQGTAGLPVFNAVKMSGACDLCVVVTRYFGGILLGAGGLVRAYSTSAHQAIDEAGLAVFCEFSVLEVSVAYPDYGRLKTALEKIGASEDSVEFGADVTVVSAIETEREGELRLTVSELTNGQGRVTLLRREERASRTT